MLTLNQLDLLKHARLDLLNAIVKTHFKEDFYKQVEDLATQIENIILSQKPQKP